MSVRPPADRFWAKVVKTDDGCWLWTGTTAGASRSYGAFRPGTRSTDPRVYVHRYAYELLIGPIPPGLELDHLCKVTLCVNPAHLEPVTPRENKRREGIRRTHCHRGHDYATGGIFWSNGKRVCRTCRSERQRRYYRERTSRG